MLKSTLLTCMAHQIHLILALKLV